MMISHTGVWGLAELPAVGAGYENLVLDLKGTNPKVGPDAFELAKDSAAFANAAGGTLLHRAYEDSKRGTLGRYEPLTAAEAATVIAAYDSAIRDRCIPAPSWTPSRFPFANGEVVAITVAPFPGQIVGVKTRGDASDGFGDSAYVFPMRVGTQTRFLQPGELPMYMVPELRMTIVALQGIPELERKKVRLLQIQGLSRLLPKDDAEILAIEPERNALRFANNTSYPLNRVRAVWYNGTQWCISVDAMDLA